MVGFIYECFLLLLGLMPTSDFSRARSFGSLEHVPDNKALIPTIRGNRLTARQQPSPSPTVCGYLEGDPKKVRGPADGFGCRTDTVNRLWGFCPTAIGPIADCGFAGQCVDRNTCTAGCGRFPNNPTIPTFTCTATGEFCSFALLVDGAGQTFDYLRCGEFARTEKYYATPITKVSAKTTAPTTTSTTPSTSLESKDSSTPTTRTPPFTTTTTTAPANSDTTESSIPSTSGSESSPSSGTSTPTSTHQPQSSAANESKSPLPIGAIVGGSIGGLALICLTVVAVVLLRRRQQKTRLGTDMDLHHLPPVYRMEHDSKYTSSTQLNVLQHGRRSEIASGAVGEGARYEVEGVSSWLHTAELAGDNVQRRTSPGEHKL